MSESNIHIVNNLASKVRRFCGLLKTFSLEKDKIKLITRIFPDDFSGFLHSKSGISVKITKRVVHTIPQVYIIVALKSAS